MAQDVRLIRNEHGIYDLGVVDHVFDTVSGLETAIVVSLFSNARAPASQIETPTKRGGWVGNILTSDTGRQVGSRLWTFDQSRLTPDIMNQVSVAAQESLSWMVEDGLAKTVNAQATKVAERKVTIDVQIVTITGKEERYSLLWRNTGAI